MNNKTLNNREVLLPADVLETLGVKSYSVTGSTRTAYRVKKHQRRGGVDKMYKCSNPKCRKTIEINEIYFAFGVRATTHYEKIHSIGGCAHWDKYCYACA